MKQRPREKRAATSSMLERRPPLVIIGKNHLKAGMLRREQPKWDKARKSMVAFRRKTKNPSEKLRQAVFIYQLPKTKNTALWFVTKEMQDRWFALPSSSAMLDAMIQDIREGPLKKYGEQQDGEYVYVEGQQFAQLVDVLDCARFLIAAEWEVGRKRAIEEMLRALIRLGQYSEEKHALRAQQMTYPRKKANPELDSLADKFFNGEGPERYDYKKSVKSAMHELGLIGEDVFVGAYDRLRQTISRKKNSEETRSR